MSAWKVHPVPHLPCASLHPAVPFKTRNSGEELKAEDTLSVHPLPHHHPKHKPRALPSDAQATQGTPRSTNLHFATLGFRKVRPSRCTSFTLSFRSSVWLLSGILQPSRHLRTVAAGTTAHATQFGGRILPTPPPMCNICI